MGTIAWIVLGLGAGLLAHLAIPGKRSHGLLTICLIGVAGALCGGWAATGLFHVGTPHAFFSLSIWLTAIAGAAVLLLAYHLATVGSSDRVRAPLRNRQRAARTGSPEARGPAASG
jgi:uncharacterized membrane protein YeaQ/YmgE (transglycosylase-associated protein family)